MDKLVLLATTVAGGATESGTLNERTRSDRRLVRVLSPTENGLVSASNPSGAIDEFCFMRFRCLDNV